MKLMAGMLGISMLSGITLGGLSACGNKGDLMLVPDELTERDLIQIKRNLEDTGEPVPEPASTLIESEEEEAARLEKERNQQLEQGSNKSEDAQ